MYYNEAGLQLRSEYLSRQPIPLTVEQIKDVKKRAVLVALTLRGSIDCALDDSLLHQYFSLMQIDYTFEGYCEKFIDELPSLETQRTLTSSLSAVEREKWLTKVANEYKTNAIDKDFTNDNPTPEQRGLYALHKAGKLYLTLDEELAVLRPQPSVLPLATLPQCETLEQLVEELEKIEVKPKRYQSRTPRKPVDCTVVWNRVTSYLPYTFPKNEFDACITQGSNGQLRFKYGSTHDLIMLTGASRVTLWRILKQVTRISQSLILSSHCAQVIIDQAGTRTKQQRALMRLKRRLSAEQKARVQELVTMSEYDDRAAPWHVRMLKARLDLLGSRLGVWLGMFDDDETRDDWLMLPDNLLYMK